MNQTLLAFKQGSEQARVFQTGEASDRYWEQIDRRLSHQASLTERVWHNRVRMLAREATLSSRNAGTAYAMVLLDQAAGIVASNQDSTLLATLTTAVIESSLSFRSFRMSDPTGAIASIDGAIEHADAAMHHFEVPGLLSFCLLQRLNRWRLATRLNLESESPWELMLALHSLRESFAALSAEERAGVNGLICDALLELFLLQGEGPPGSLSLSVERWQEMTCALDFMEGALDLLSTTVRLLVQPVPAADEFRRDDACAAVRAGPQRLGDLWYLLAARLYTVFSKRVEPADAEVAGECLSESQRWSDLPDRLRPFWTSLMSPAD